MNSNHSLPVRNLAVSQLSYNSFQFLHVITQLSVVFSFPWRFYQVISLTWTSRKERKKALAISTAAQLINYFTHDRHFINSRYMRAGSLEWILCCTKEQFATRVLLVIMLSMLNWDPKPGNGEHKLMAHLLSFTATVYSLTTYLLDD